MCWTVTKETLITNLSIMSDIAFVPMVAYVGIFCATLSAALSTISGGSRILQALAKDDLIPFLKFFKKGSGKTDEPRRAIIFTYILMQVSLIFNLK